MELTEEYIGRESDGMIGMHVTFGMAKKEFGPADGKGGAKEVCKITEKFAENPAGKQVVNRLFVTMNLNFKTLGCTTSQKYVMNEVCHAF